MTIGALNPNMSIVDTSSKIGVAMLSKTLDASQTEGAAMVDMMNKSMMEQSVNPHIGSMFDMSI